MRGDGRDPRQPLWRRILSLPFLRAVAESGDETILAVLPTLTAEQLHQLQAAYDERFEAQAAFGAAAGQHAYTDQLGCLRARIAVLNEQAAAFIEEMAAFEGRRCRRLCCPALAPHDRTHPSCVVRPSLWQDDGDQA